jgi:PAT family beta-lactamase induction signal transducer AmpG
MPSKKTLAWVALLYAAQGLPYGVTSKIWPVYFRVHGVSLKEIGLMGLLALPWSWKPLWAPLVDRFGSRKAWIVPFLFLLAAISVAMPMLPAAHVGRLLVGLMLAFTISSATQDIAIDAWAVDVSSGGKLGSINGVRAAAFRVAVIAAGGVALFVADRFGWQAAWSTVAVLFAILAIGTLFLPEAERTEAQKGESRTTREIVRGFFAWVFRREMLPIVLFALLFKLPTQAISRMTDPFWLDSKLKVSDIAFWSNTVGIGIGMVGALLGGWLINRVGLYRALVAFALFEGTASVAYAVAAAFSPTRPFIYTASALEMFAQGLGTAGLLAFLTACCRREAAATEYALLSALFAFSRELAGGLSGFGAERMGYAGFFAFTAFLAIPALLLLPWLRPYLPAREAAAGSPP